MSNYQSHPFLSPTRDANYSETQVKVCGITRTNDAQSAAQAGAHALGFIFYGPSPRNVKCDQARTILNEVPTVIASVAVVVDPDDELLSNIINEVNPNFIQFHGNESPMRCREAGLPYIKALRVQSTEQIQQAVDNYSDASAFLLDAYVKNQVGGTGRTFSWDLVPKLDAHIVLAGGLSAGNVSQAIDNVRPTAVDVSTGVEVSAGIKDKQEINRFMAAVKKTRR